MISASDASVSSKARYSACRSSAHCGTRGGGDADLVRHVLCLCSRQPGHRIDVDLVDLLRRCWPRLLRYPCRLRSTPSAPPAAKPRSTTMPMYNSLAIAMPSSISRRFTMLALGAGLVGDEPHSEYRRGILPAVARDSWRPSRHRPCRARRRESAPSRPRPGRRASWLQPTASSTLKQGIPRGVATPYLRRISLA